MKIFTIIKTNFLLSLTFFSAAVFADVFQTELERTQWHFEGDRFACRISHDISGFGELDLIAAPDASLELQVSSQWLNLENTQIRADVVVPSWHRDQHTEYPSFTLAAQNKQLASVSDDRLIFFLNSVAGGHGIQITLNNEIGETFSAVANGIGSKFVSEQFRHCYARLLPKPYSYVRRVDLTFDSGRSGLNQNHEQDLQAVALYVRADPSVEKVLVDAHADGNGHHLANLVLSKARADEVASRLVELGLAADMIEARHHGERMPLVSNATAKGRELNRRVTVKLVKKRQVAE